MNEPSIKKNDFASLVKELFAEIICLVTEHIRLLREEFQQDSSRLVKMTVFLISAIAISYLGLIFLGIAIIVALTYVLPTWAAVLIVAALYWIIPVIFILMAIFLFKKVFNTPKKSVEEFKKTSKEFNKWLQSLKS